MRRKILARTGVCAALLIAAASAAWWLADQAAFVTTADARVRARMVTLSFEIGGRIADIPLRAGDRITVGQLVAQLDDRKARLALGTSRLELKALEIGVGRERLDAEISEARGAERVSGRTAGLEAAVADLAAARAELARGEGEHARASALSASGLVTRAALERTHAALEVARQAVARAEAEVANRRAGVGEARAEIRAQEVTLRNAEAMAASAHALRNRVALLKVELDQHAVLSPIDGVIDEVFAEPGEHVAPGVRLALAHAPDGVWLEAHVKEPDLPRVNVGAQVEIHLDAAQAACDGVVERIGDAATSEFALIPNANPAGVFTKITQRVPVRVRLGGACGTARPGAMATIRIRAG